ncbi:MAG: CaiB/BaiF CoA transferase family protein [Pararhodobacter sp.]
MTAALQGLRVLDLAGPFGNYAGKLFADLGADVILVEPPRGAPTRSEPPMAPDVPAPESSFRFAYENTSKRSIVLDLTAAADRETFLDLAAHADLVLESSGPGILESLGLDGETLRSRNPALVLHRLSPFGQTGPLSGHRANDLTLMAMGGMLYLAGYPDTAPIVAGGRQAVACGNLFGAVAAILAVTQAEITGKGEDVDTSVQESVAMGMENSIQFYDLEGTVRQRYAGDQRQAGAGIFACADGEVYLLAGGIAANKFWFNTLDWLRQSGIDVTPLEGTEWLDVTFLRTQTAKDGFRRIFESFSMGHDKAALYRKAQAARVPLCPVATPADVRVNRQLSFRDYFTDVPDGLPGLDLVMPGAPYHLSATPWRITRRPPRLDEHGAEIRADLHRDKRKIRV